MDLDHKIARFSSAVLLATIFLSAFVFAYLVWAYGLMGERYFSSPVGPLLYYGPPITLMILLSLAFRLPPAHRINLALVLVSIGTSLFVSELLLGHINRKFLVNTTTFTATFLGGDIEDRAAKDKIRSLAKEFGVDFDTRSRLEVIKDFRERGVPAVPSGSTQEFLKEQPDGNAVSQLRINGSELLPLGGISNRPTVLGNEIGQYIVYNSDEHGFHNPKGLWAASQIDIAALGDSFTQGFCVPSSKNFVALIRDRYPRTLNLGNAGAGPLVELAALTEYLAHVKPKVALWFYFDENDQVDLLMEQKSALLQRYLEDDHSQDLLNRQADIDHALTDYVDVAMRRALEAQETVRQKRPNVRPVEVLIESFKLTHLRQRLGLVHGEDHRQRQASERQMQLFRKILSKAKARVESWGGTLYFVYLPGRERYRSKIEYERTSVLTLVKNLDLPVIDIHQDFESHGDPLSLFPFRRFGHYTEEGNQIVAKRVLGAIRLRN